MATGPDADAVWLSDEYDGIQYRLEGDELDATPEMADPQADLALLQVTGQVTAPVIPLADETKIRVGARWHTNGYPDFHNGPFALSGTLPAVSVARSGRALQVLVEQGTRVIRDETGTRVIWAAVSGSPVLIEGAAAGVVTSTTGDVATGWAASLNALVALLRLANDVELRERCRALLDELYPEVQDLAHLTKDHLDVTLPEENATTTAAAAQWLSERFWRSGFGALLKLLQGVEQDRPAASQVKELMLEIGRDRSPLPRFPRLRDLEDAWLAHPLGKNRDPGGRRSLHGFRYQLALSLKRFLDAIESGEPAATTAFDSVTDLGCLDGDLIYLIQVKTTDRPRLRRVAEEALALDEFLEDEFPDWRPRIRFRIWCQDRRTPADLSSLSADELELEDEAAFRWTSLHDRLETVEIRSGPYHSLVVRLFRQVPDPFVLVDTWLGSLIRLLGEERSSQEIVDALLSSLQTQQARLQATPPGRLLDLRDATELGEGLDILVGERPRLDDLVRGCFMARPDRLSGVLHAVDKCFAEATSPPLASRTVPVVWVGGTSGCGKISCSSTRNPLTLSVLMLQAVAELTGRPDVVTHLLAPMSGQLPEALAFWHKTSERVVIAIDDMYAPEVRDNALWSRVHAVIFESRWFVPPVVLTCGPDEDFRAFKRHALRGGGLSYVEVPIPMLNPKEVDLYHAWFCDRTGTEVRPVREENFASAAFLLELHRHGEDRDLGQFAARLNDRLVSLGVREVVLAVLAGMTLGFPVPAAVFAGHESGLDRLLREGLLRRREGAHEESVVSFFHPRVARALYDHLVPADEEHERAGYLAHCFEISRSVPEHALLLLTRLDGASMALAPQVARLALEEIWQRLTVQEVPEVEISLVRKWFTSAVSQEMRLTSALNRVGRWLASPDLEPGAWAFLFQLAVDHGREEGDELLDKAVPWLAEHADLPGWNYVWQRVWKFRGEDEHLVRLALDWLPDHADSPGWSYIFQKLYDGGLRGQEILTLGFEGVLRKPSSPADWHVWRKVMQLAEKEQPAEGPSRFLKTLVARLCREFNPYLSKKGYEIVVDQIKMPRRKKAAEVAEVLRQEIKEPA